MQKWLSFLQLVRFDCMKSGKKRENKLGLVVGLRVIRPEVLGYVFSIDFSILLHACLLAFQSFFSVDFKCLRFLFRVLNHIRLFDSSFSPIVVVAKFCRTTTFKQVFSSYLKCCCIQSEGFQQHLN